LVGTILEGTYRITRLIGKGGMGAVYEGRQLRLDKRVAVKVMARALADSHEALARFRREAEITSALGHPHIVNVTDFGVSISGAPFLVMEYLEGEDLDHRIHRLGQLPLEATAHITKQIASALAIVHGKGIVHRDLKPANVFLLDIPGEPAFVKLLDFGISKVTTIGGGLTAEGRILGTPEYLSPEQLSPKVGEIDHRTDQWSLGCIVWEMLSGRKTFDAEDLPQVLLQITESDPSPLAECVPGLPAGVEPVLRRALAKHQAERFPSIVDFANAFAAAAIERSVEVTPPLVTPRAIPLKRPISRRPGGAEPVSPKAKSVPPPPARPEATPHATAGGDSGVLELVGVGGRKSFRIRTAIGRRLLRNLGVDSQYWDERQFVVERRGSNWVLVPNLAVTNQTLLNGATVDKAAVLKNGDVLGVGDETTKTARLPLTVRIR
jgi:serine/threonine protein kinase